MDGPPSGLSREWSPEPVPKLSLELISAELASPLPEEIRIISGSLIADRIAAKSLGLLLSVSHDMLTNRVAFLIRGET